MDLAIKQLLSWTAAHHDVVTDAVLRSLGLSIEQRKRLVTSGVLERVLDGSYRFAGTGGSELSRCVAACARPGGLIIAGPTAGRLWGLRRVSGDLRVHVIAPPASNPSLETWLVPYRTAAIEPTDVIDRDDGIRVTSAARTAVDLMRHLSAVDVRSVVDQVEHRGLATAAEMRRVAEPIATPGRAWARRFLELLDRRAGGGPAESHWESRVAGALIDRGIDGMTRQHWLDVPHWGRVRLDLCIERLKWGLEIDGFPDHFTEAGSTSDTGRDLACEAIGWDISRVTTLALEADFEERMEAICRVIRRRQMAALRPPHVAS